MGRFIALLGLSLVAALPAWAQDAPAKTVGGTAVIPVPKDKENWWMQRHQLINARAKAGNVEVLFIGDSITHGWEGDGQKIWQEKFAPLHPMNAGISGDRTEHVLWRLDHGNMEGIKPKVAVIMIGTNNVGSNQAEETAAGIKAIVDKLRDKLPATKILLLAIFPRGVKANEGARLKNEKVNQIIAKLDDGKHVFYRDIGPKFLTKEGTLTKEIMPDALHPNAQGYQIWADALEQDLKKLLQNNERL